MQMMLEIINSCLCNALHHNPHLIYTLLYQQEMFVQLRTHVTFQDLIQNIETVSSNHVTVSFTWKHFTSAIPALYVWLSYRCELLLCVVICLLYRRWHISKVVWAISTACSQLKIFLPIFNRGRCNFVEIDSR